MLKELQVKNFAIIDDVRISFEAGLNCLTGETGSICLSVRELIAT